MKRIAIVVVLSACTGTIEGLEPDSDAGSATGSGAASGSAQPDGGADSTGAAADSLCGIALPKVAPPTLRVSGSIVRHPDNPWGTWADFPVELWRRGDSTPLTSIDSSGDFDFTVVTGGAPIDAYLHASDPPTSDLYQFFEQPLAANWNFSILMADVNVFSSIAPLQPNTGVILVGMRTCDGPDGELTGASVAITPAGVSTIRYLAFDAQGNAVYLTAPSSSSSVAIIVNAPAGPITITSSSTSPAMRTANVIAFADSFTATEMWPQ